MATRKWTGVTNGNAGTTTNWSGDTLPVDNDIVIFDSGAVDVDAGLSALLEIDLDLLVITEGYTGQIGTGWTARAVAASTAHADSDASNINIDGEDVSADFPVGDVVYNSADKTWHRITNFKQKEHYR